MCGILLQFNPASPLVTSEFEAALQLLTHRGPDHQGHQSLMNGQLMMGQTRLSFMDLSPNGHAPMSNAQQTLWAILNGEIYNYQELRKEWEHQYPFKSHSDTEILLAGYTLLGNDFLSKLKGMFAFALVDTQTNTILAARDRFGIKPLYFHHSTKGLALASELKPLHHLGLASEIDPTSIADYLTYRFIPSPKCIWQGIGKLEPGQVLTFNTQQNHPKFTSYWSLNYNPSSSSLTTIKDEFRDKLLTSIEQHSRADVAIGGFQSAGMDSSAISLGRHLLGEKIDTYSIGFDSWQNSEHGDAALIAQQLEHRHHVRMVTDSDYDILQRMPICYDEPIADISILPTYLVSELAAKGNKAVMGGEGADELLGGYHWQHSWNMNQANAWNRWRYKPQQLKNHYIDSMSMGLFDNQELYAAAGNSLIQYIQDDPFWFYQQHLRSDIPSQKALQWLDIRSFMGELVLTKIDRASMAHSLEVRVPFLDHELVEFLFNLPTSVIWKKGQQKPLLQSFLSPHVPAHLYNRPKQGFVGPDPFYMNKDLYRNGLKNSLLVQQGWIKADYIEQQLNQDYNWKLWKLLILENWLKHWT